MACSLLVFPCPISFPGESHDDKQHLKRPTLFDYETTDPLGGGFLCSTCATICRSDWFC